MPYGARKDSRTTREFPQLSEVFFHCRLKACKGLLGATCGRLTGITSGIRHLGHFRVEERRNPPIQVMGDGLKTSACLRFQHVFIQQEIVQPHVLDSVFVKPRSRDGFAYNNSLERILYGKQRTALLLKLVGIGNSQCGLNIIALVRHVHHKVNFTSVLMSVAVSIPFHDRYDTDIDRIPAQNKFVVQDIFHDVGFFFLPEIEMCIPKTNVRTVVFHWEVEVMLSLHIVPFCTTEQECIGQAFKVALNRGMVYLA